MAKSKGKAAKKSAKAKPAKKAAKSKIKSVAKKTKKPVAKKKPVKKASPKKAVKAKIVSKKKAVSKPKVKVTKKKTLKAKPVKKTTVKLPKVTKKTLGQLKKKVAAKTDLKPQPKYEVKVKPNHKNESKRRVMYKNLDLRYSDEELREFKVLIDKKLVSARDELKYLKEALDNHNDNQAGNKAWNMEEGTDTSEMETLMNQISRQHQYIRNLELALIRIENKTYGICRVTGKLIPKERLRVVPHATLSLEAKLNRKSDDDIQNAALSTTPPTEFAEDFED